MHMFKKSLSKDISNDAQVSLTATWTQTKAGVGEYTWVRMKFLHECIRNRKKTGMVEEGIG